MNADNYRILNSLSSVMLLMIVGFSSCVPPDPITNLSPEDKDLYVTNRDQSVNFSNYQTYVIVDSVKVVSKSADSINRTISSAPLILSTINDELQKNGFVKVDTSQKPDVGISVSVLKFSEQTPIGSYPNFGSSIYFGYVSPAFYGFSGYAYSIPPYYGIYQIDVGSISIDMYDLKTARKPGENKLNLIWSALLVGTLADTGADTNERIVKAIISAFEQSPYLHDGK